MLTPEMVRASVEELAKLAGDYERAHEQEDSLHRTVLSLIASKHCSDPSACAAEALKTHQIQFSRNYA